MPDSHDPARQEVEHALADCQGDRNAALLLLDRLLVNVGRSCPVGLLRLTPFVKKVFLIEKKSDTIPIEPHI